MSVTLAAVSVVTVLVLLYYWIQHSCSERIRCLRALPTALPTIPLLGHFHHLLFTTEGTQTKLISFINKINSFRHRIVCVWVGMNPMVFVNHPEDVQIVLNSSKILNKGPDYSLMKFAAGQGLLTADVPIWKVTRRHMVSLFHPRNLEHMVPVFNRTSQLLVQQLSNKGAHEPIDINNYLVHFTVINVQSFMSGSKMAAEIDSMDAGGWNEAAIMAAHLVGARFAKPWLRWESIFTFLYNKQIQILRRAFGSLQKSILKAVEEQDRISQGNTNDIYFFSKSPTRHHKEGGNKNPVSLPEIYKNLQMEHAFINKESVNYEINTIFLNGTDSTAVTISNCLLALAKYPDIQTKLYNEIVEELGAEEGIVTQEDVSKLKYLDCVLKETNRKFTAIPFLTRTNEVEIKLGDCTLPPGTNIAVNIMGIHSDPRLYPDPERFDPDRFSTENVAQRHKYAFIPFSGGARDCIGKQYASLIMKIALVHLLREFRFSTTVNIDELKYSFETIMISRGAHRVTLEKRKK